MVYNNKKIKRRSVGKLIRAGVIFFSVASVFNPSITLADAVPLKNRTVQMKEIRGLVKNEFGENLLNVTVRVKGQNTITVTNNSGEFTISANVGDTLVFSLVGYESMEFIVNQSSSITIQLTTLSTELSEVTVTALGIKREKKSLGYSVQEIKGETFDKIKEPNIIASLTGQVAGLTVYNKTGTFQAPAFNIRGATNILIVIDGVPMGTDTWSINPDDVEKMDVIKGATGAALYGAAGANGVIMISTKKGANNDSGLSINFNSSSVFNTGYVALPEYQTEYGQGLNGQYAADQTYLHMWGPRLNQEDPSTPSGFVELVQWNSPIDPVTGQKIPLPWIKRNENPISDIMQNGYTLNNSLSVGGNNEFGDFRIGYNDIYKKGNTPNTNLFNKTIDVSGGYRFYDKLTVDAKVSYNNLASDNYEDVGYNWDNFILHIGNNLGSNVDLEDLKNYWVEGKEGLTQRTWVPGRNNPYWLLNENIHVYNRDRFSGWLKADYSFTEYLNFTARVSQVYNSIQQENKENKGNLAITSDLNGSYSNSSNRSTDFNAEWLLRYNKRHLDNILGVDMLAGGSARSISSRALTGGAASLILSDFYNLSNKADFNTASNSSSTKKVNSFYGTVNLDYQSKIFVGVTGRNDWSSALQRPYNSYFYPSVSTSIVVSELVTLPSMFSFAKLRGSWATGRNDVAAFWNDMVYSIGNYNGMPTASYGASLNSLSLMPDRTESAEVGIDLRLFKNRLSFDMAFFTKKDLDQISVTAISNASGFTGRRENGAGIVTKGFEYTISGTPIKTANFNWNTTVNLSYYKQYVHSLAPGQDRYASFYRVGERINRTRGLEFIRNDNGDIIYENGLPMLSTIYQPISSGSYNDPKLVYGFINNFRYKNWGLNLVLDGRIGGVIYNYMYANMMISGAAKQTAQGNVRDLPYVGNGVKVIGGEVLTDVRGNIVYDSREYAENDVQTDYYAWVQRAYRNNYSVNAFDATHLKLREASVTYNFPKSWLNKTFIKNVSASLVGRNLLLFTNVLYTDPDVGDDDAGQGPSVRNIGFNLNVTF